MTKLSLEQFENGIQIYQDETLYKFTSDSIKLAKFCKINHADNVLDMCAGCGVVGFYAYSIKPFNKLYLNDIQPEMCELIDKNIELNSLQNKCKIICKNLKYLTIQDFGKLLDVIVCNPPYFKYNGRINESVNIAASRHEIYTNFNQIASTASKLLKDKGKFFVVMPADRLCESVCRLAENKLVVKRLEMYSHNSSVTLCLIEAVKNAGDGVKIKVINE